MVFGGHLQAGRTGVAMGGREEGAGGDGSALLGFYLLECMRFTSSVIYSGWERGGLFSISFHKLHFFQRVSVECHHCSFSAPVLPVR